MQGKKAKVVWGRSRPGKKGGAKAGPSGGEKAVAAAE